MAEPRTVPVVTQAKVPVGELTLPESLFGGPVRRHLLYETVKMQRANRRAGSAATKTRGAGSGGGEKPGGPEGRRPGARRHHPLANLGRRRHDLRTAAARLFVPDAGQRPQSGAARGARP